MRSTDNRMKSVLLLILLVSLTTIATSAQQPTSQLRLFDLDGRLVEPFAGGRIKAQVFIFVRTDCPISNRYAPEIERLYRKFAPDSINFWLVYPDKDESAEVIKKHLKEYGYRLVALRDPQHTLVSLAGVEVTPEAAVFVPGRRLIYRGRIDDRFVAFGKSRPLPTVRDLEKILEVIRHGEPVTKRTTLAVGCYISDLP